MTAGFNNSVLWFWYMGSFLSAARVIGRQHVVLSENAEKYLLTFLVELSEYHIYFEKLQRLARKTGSLSMK
jgi:hypothetical protein